ncbi:MAG: AMP-binding protein, partial [Bacteroidales bacterium]|nr:AMP-binding protein [Bacteroidales bacterium]
MFLKSGEKTAIISGDEKITYNQVVQKVIEFSSFYKVNPDDRVVIFAENRPGWAYAFYSAFNNKSIVVPIDHLSVSSEVSYILNDCTPKVIFTSKAKLPVLQDAIQSLSYTPQIILIDTKEAVQPVVDVPSDFEIPYKPNKSAVIIYTSGTTGHPKGVVLSQENLYINMKAVTKDIRIIIPEERILMLLPLHHIFPLQGTLMIPFHLGATIAISPSLATNDILSTLQDNKVSLIIGVPRLYETIHKG